MSSNRLHHQKSNSNPGEIKHTAFLSEHIGALFLSSNYSDLTLKIENDELHAHKVILAARSEYFRWVLFGIYEASSLRIIHFSLCRALLYGGLRESTQNEIIIKDSSVEAFKALLKYIYTGFISLNNVKVSLLLVLCKLLGFNWCFEAKNCWLF